MYKIGLSGCIQTHSNPTQNPNSEVSSTLEVSSTRLNARERQETSVGQRRKALRKERKEEDRREAAFSFFLRLHQRAESQLIPYFIKTVDPSHSYNQKRRFVRRHPKGTLPQTFRRKRKQRQTEVTKQTMIIRKPHCKMQN